jgi:hypothetical protein
MRSTLLDRSIAELGSKFIKDIKYVDIDYRGFITEFADPTISAGAVMVNDLKLWVQSSQGDYYRRPTMGGFFDTIQKYSFSSIGANQLNQDLRSAINQNFETIEIMNLEVTPDIENRGWKLQLIVRDTTTGIIAPLVTGVDA